MPLSVGESVGHYQIVEEIGAGGGGRVLKVEHLITRRREAMKILVNGKPSSQEYAHRFLREIRLQASLDHPNIAAVLNAFWLEDDLVMVMELIQGESLQKMLAKRKPQMEQGMAIIKQVLEALEYAHQNGVVHRDVSTANIIVGPDGRVKLTDFGLAKASADLSVTETGVTLGSPYYISPEQVRGTAATDQRSDIYSTGVVLYELLTGSRPFEAPSAFLLMQAHVQQPPHPPIERNPSIPHFINNAILKAMSKNPWERFQTAGEFLAAIEGPGAFAAPMEVAAPLVSAPIVSSPVVSAPVAPLPVPSASNVVAASTPTTTPVSHSYAAPIPPDPAPKPAKSASLLRRVWNSPLTGAAIGILAVLAAVSPVVFYDFSSGRPRYSMEQLSLPPISVPAPAVPEDKTVPTPSKDRDVLVSGPKQLPTYPPSQGGRVAKTSPVRKVVDPVAPTPPKIVVWGDASAQRPATTPPAPKPEPRKMEDPPAVPTAKPQSSIDPTLPQPEGPPQMQRKGFLSRLAQGVKSLNPVKRSSPPTDPTGFAAEPKQ